MAWEFARDLGWLLRGIDLAYRASRRERKARALAKSGRHEAAMAELTRALELLSRPRVNRLSPPAMTVIMYATKLFDEVATALGTPLAARVRLEEALAVLDAFRDEVARRRKKDAPNVVELHPDKNDSLLGFEEWFRHRLSLLAG
jgi:hypothetical protein